MNLPTSMRLTLESCVIVALQLQCGLQDWNLLFHAAGHAEPRRDAPALFGDTYIAGCPMISGLSHVAYEIS